MEKKTFEWWIIFITLCIWQFPQLLVGLIMMPFMKKRTLVADRHYNFCWRSSSMSGGISLGPISYVSKYQKEEGIAHEVDGHTVQSKILGWFYLPLIGIPSIMWALTYNCKKHCYYDFYTEKNANLCADLEVDNYCKLHFKNKNGSH